MTDALPILLAFVITALLLLAACGAPKPTLEVPQNLHAGLTSKEVKMIEELIEQFAVGAERSINAGDWEAYGGLFVEDLLMVTPSLPGVTRGREARVQLVQAIMNPFPDGVVEVQRSFGRGDWACLEVLFTGTHTEPMPGPGGTEIPPTNKAVKLPYCMVMKFEDGLVSELYEYYDQLDLMTQLGLA